ncbi:family 43 glycosylhydrolase [Pontibacter mangrovi]|uniref:1,4-beta-xylanase n=1 Tax=Pontibacter mangrovi TaxID=2589816 RepID=A0A501W6R4_9BACT|nr:family 43 glycosylhydrolase [Pontibacter mangrovi]TPE44422.1 1,4-beta-xylanase [Pontibacter mangrovi]
MKKVSQAILALAILLGSSITALAQSTQMSTYCNPINIDYTYAVYDAYKDISYRSGADPAVVEFRNEYYMFVTRSMGYWHSTDLQNWNFIKPEKWYFQGSNAPAAFNYKDSVLYVTGDPSGSMSILYTDDPQRGDWKATPGILTNLQDPALFIDDDGKAYVYWGSSNTYPIKVQELDREDRFKPVGEVKELFTLHGDKHGWERFGENHSDTTLAGYMEGAWMTKHNGKYYLQYAAPGTEFNVYGDGVYIGDSPLGPFTYAPNNPVSYKPGGYMNGAGHGSTLVGPAGEYWHFGSASVSVNMNWERRINMFHTSFDKDGLMHADTYFGDYPHYGPAVPGKAGEFAGWMLLSYKKPAKASSVLENFKPENMLDESTKTFWVAEQNNDQQWVQVDLQKPGKVYAVQVNYHDYKSDLYGKEPGLYHRYVVEGSTDGKSWQTLVDRSDNYRDVPNDYVELGTPKTVRYVRFRNIHAPTPNLAISGLRVFGVGQGKAPVRVKNFKVNRQQDRRDAMITWDRQANAQGYNVLWGIAPDKLYNSWMVYDDNKLNLKSLGVDQGYYFTIEAFNENGVSQRTKVMKVD